MIANDSATAQAHPVMQEEEFRNLRVERPYFLRPTSQSFDVIKIPPQWTWQVEPVKRVLECLSLKENWDSYGGKVPSLAIAIAVVDVIDRMPANNTVLPRVVPLSTGGIQLELSRGSKGLEIEFSPNGAILYLQSDGDKEVEDSATLSQEQITSWMTWLTAA